MEENNGKYIRRCLELAKLGKGNVSPNPMVGSVIVFNNQIIGEGYHMQYGEPHAEVNAINSVKDKSLLPKSTIYVSLEPCSHFGKTPPCADLIIKHKIPNVVISSLDENEIVCGNGVKKLKSAGVNVTSGVLEQESKRLNKTFNKFQNTKLPWVILKWAQTADGFIDHERTGQQPNALQISNSMSSTYVHKLRAEVDAILVGKNTVIKDNPSLTTRKWFGANPLRIVIDKNLDLDRQFKVFDNNAKTIVFNSQESKLEGQIEFVKIPFNTHYLKTILMWLGSKGIQSILVEGGAFTLQQFINHKQFDECIVITAPQIVKQGIKAPEPNFHFQQSFSLGNNNISIYE